MQHIRNTKVSIYIKPHDQQAEYFLLTKTSLSRLVSNTDFDKIDGLLSSSIQAKGTLSLSGILAAKDYRVCGPSLLHIVLDEDRLYLDKDRTNNIYNICVVVKCPEDYIAIHNVHPFSNSHILTVANHSISWTVLEANSLVILRQSKFVSFVLDSHLWRRDAELSLSDMALNIESFYIREKNLNLNDGLGSVIEMVEVDQLKPVQEFDNENYFSVKCHAKFKASKELCQYFSIEGTLENVENIGLVQRSVVWILKVTIAGVNELVEYNNKFEMITDIACGGGIDVKIPDLPDDGALLLYPPFNNGSSLIYYRQTVSFRLHLDINVKDQSSLNRVCDTSRAFSEANGSNLETILCPAGSLKSNIQLLVSFDTYATTTEQQPFVHALANQIIDLNEGQVVAFFNAVNSTDKIITVSLKINDVQFDHDDIFILCSESTSALNIQVCARFMKQLLGLL